MVLEKNSSKQLDLQEPEDFPFYDSMTSPAVRSPGLSDTAPVPLMYLAKESSEPRREQEAYAWIYFINWKTEKKNKLPKSAAASASLSRCKCPVH